MERARNDQLVISHIAKRDALYRHAALPLYGLPASFEGPRALGESAITEEDGVESVEYLGLTHGRQHESEPHIHVITATAHGAPEPLEVLAGQAGVVLSPGWRAADTIQALVDARGPVRRITRSLLIDGQAIEAGGFEAGRHWILQAPAGEYVVTVAGSNYPSEGVTLVRVTSVDDYVAGTRQLLGRL